MKFETEEEFAERVEENLKAIEEERFEDINLPLRTIKNYNLEKFQKIQTKANCKAYREANKDKIAEQKKAYYEANKEYFKAYYEANKDKIAEQNKAYREANKDKIAEQKKAYYEANKDKIKAYRKAYYQRTKK
jgi:hypothetical protein